MEHPLLAPEFSERTRTHPHRALVERIAASQPFQSSPRLRSFLLYVADCAMRDAPEEATEQHIGIHVFQRAAGYNSSEDSIVRTNARMLRQKLADYFGHEGSGEETVIDIPKGHYLPVFRPRVVPAEQAAVPMGLPVSTPAALPAVPPEPPPSTARRFLPRWRKFALPVLLVTLCVGAVLAGIAGWKISHAPTSAVDRFWAPFLSGNSLVIYSNALFVGDSTKGLRYASAGTDPPSPLSSDYVDTYTGIGELASVYDLTRLFDSRHAQFTLKRSLLVTWDEARMQNLIFIGSVAENPSLRVLPETMNFTLTRGDGWAGILNHQPKPGEQALYSRPEHPLTHDYAILALLPGLEQGRRMLIFSGLMTMGTQAAVEFVCHPEGAEQILRFAQAPDGSIRPFEAVLETTLGGGVPLQTRIVAIHLR